MEENKRCVICNSSEHSALMSVYNGEVLCPICKSLKQLADIQNQISDINNSLRKALKREAA